MFADNLRRILQLKLIHQTELAKQLGVSRQTVNKWCADVDLGRSGLSPRQKV